MVGFVIMKTRIHGYWDNEDVAEDDGEVHFEPYNGLHSRLVPCKLGRFNRFKHEHDATMPTCTSSTATLVWASVEGIHMVDGDKEYLYVV